MNTLSRRDHNLISSNFRVGDQGLTSQASYLQITISTKCLSCLEASRQDVTRLINKQETSPRLNCLSLPIKLNVDFKQDSLYVSQSTPRKEKMISYLLIVGELPLTVSQQEGKPVET